MLQFRYAKLIEMYPKGHPAVITTTVNVLLQSKGSEYLCNIYEFSLLVFTYSLVSMVFMCKSLVKKIMQ